MMNLRRPEPLGGHWAPGCLRVLKLVEAIMRDPFSGIGKPEPLKHMGGKVWSRRITQEHRIVYVVREDRVDFLMCRYHYRPYASYALHRSAAVCRVSITGCSSREKPA